MSLTIAQKIAAVDAAVGRTAQFVGSDGTATMASAQALLTAAVTAGTISKAKLRTLAGYLQQLQGPTSDPGEVYLGAARSGVEDMLSMAITPAMTLMQAFAAAKLNNPHINQLATGVTVAVGTSASGTATLAFDDTAGGTSATGTVCSNQGADTYVNFGGQFVIGAQSVLPAPGAAPFGRSNGAIGIHWFKTKSQEVEVVLGSSGAASTARVRVIVDDGTGPRYTDRAGYQTGGAGAFRMNILFGDTRPIERVIGIEHVLDVRFGKIYVLPGYTVAPACTDRPVLAVSGDSTVELTVGDSGTYTRAAVWQSVLRDMSGCDVRGFGIGGTGFVAPGTSYPFSQNERIDQVCNLEEAQGALWACSTNDGERTQAELRAATFKIIDRVRAARGAAFPMGFMGMYGGGDTANANHVNVETWVLGAVSERIAAGDKKLAVMPHLTSANPIPKSITINAGIDINHNTVNGYVNIGKRIFDDVSAAFAAMGA